MGMPLDQDQKISAILKDQFGFETLRFEQEKTIQSIINQNDTLVIMPTGGGKSLCYQLPALYNDGITIVISPLISLMQDQVDNLDQMGIASGFLNSTQTLVERRKVEEKLTSGLIKIIYIAPEGVLSPSNLMLLKSLEVSLIAIDEAHCVSQWGHEFRPDYTRLGELKVHFPNVPTLALTATADARTREDISGQLILKKPNVFVSTFDRPNIKYMIYEKSDEVKQLNDFLKQNHQGETGIVYCLSRKKVERVTDELCEMGYTAVAYHAGLTSKQRERAQRRFKTEEEIIVVATIAFGMGIDRPDVRFVAHLDLPKSIEGYYQETGRAGRDGEPSSAWMVYGLSDVVKLSRMLEQTDAHENYKRVARAKLDSMLSLCESLSCRRKVLLNYFGQECEDSCGNCDACLEPQESFDGTIPAQKLLSTIFRTGQVFGSGHVIDVLRGSQSAKVIERGHTKLSVYGVGKEYSKNEWNSVIRQLLTQGYLKIKDWEYRSLGLTEKSRPLLRGEESINLRKIRGKSSPSKAKKSKKQQAYSAEHGRPELFEALRELRMKLAKENSVPPYIVFSDKTLHDMCSILPKTKDQMLMVHGVGASKFDKYGEDFISAVNQAQ